MNYDGMEQLLTYNRVNVCKCTFSFLKEITSKICFDQILQGLYILNLLPLVSIFSLSAAIVDMKILQE
jgi:hypothetical protein